MARLRSPRPRTGDAGDHLVTNEDGVLAFKNVERFVLAMVYVKRGSGATRTRHFDSTEYAAFLEKGSQLIGQLVQSIHAAVTGTAP